MTKQSLEEQLMKTHIYQHNDVLELERGDKIQGFTIAYHTYGVINADKSNVVWVCHALTANSDVSDWWNGLFGEQDYFNPDEHYVVCANVLGSPYGSTNPTSTDPASGNPYLLNFPSFTIRDLAHCHELLARHLDIDRINVLIGGSLGGQQAMEWAITSPDRIEHLVLLATNAQHSPWGIAFNESQRLTIAADPTFYAGKPSGGAAGLKAARSIALLSYRSYHTYSSTQREEKQEVFDDFRASSYQNYQGEKLVRRFNAYSYWYLSKAMDSHHVGRYRESNEKALSGIKANTLVIGITSDLLFPIEEQRFLARHIPEAELSEIDSFYGHDGFLIETAAIALAIDGFLKRCARKKEPKEPKHSIL